MALIISLITVTMGFIYTMFQRHVDFRMQRKSVAVLIMVEIKEVVSGHCGQDIDWDTIKKHADNGCVMIAHSSDVNILHKIELEKYKFPAEVIYQVQHFFNAVTDFATCVETINHDRFPRLPKDRRDKIINHTTYLSKTINERAETAEKTLIEKLPKSYFNEAFFKKA